MVDKWVRIVADGTADTASNDTTETQIGTGVTVPSWAHSCLAARFHLGDITMTTAEDIAGYFRLANDNNTIDPLNYPMQVIPANLAGAAAGQMFLSPITVPVMQNVEPNDIVRMYAAFDAATTGVHLFGGYLLFSSDAAPMRLHCQKMAATAIGDALAESASVDINTLAGKTGDLLGILGYVNAAGTMVAAESVDAYMRVKSAAAGWQEQRLGLNHENAGLGADTYVVTAPIAYLYADQKDLLDWFGGFEKAMLGAKSFHIGQKETFSFTAQNTRDPDNNIDAVFRGFLLWKE